MASLVGQGCIALLENEVAAFGQVADNLLVAVFKEKCVGCVVLFAVWDWWTLVGVAGLTVGSADIVAFIVGFRGLGFRNERQGIVRLYLVSTLEALEGNSASVRCQGPGH